MFSSRSPFQTVRCPAYPDCFLPNCLFSHDTQWVTLSSSSTPRTITDAVRRPATESQAHVNRSESESARSVATPGGGSAGVDEQTRLAVYGGNREGGAKAQEVSSPVGPPSQQGKSKDASSVKMRTEQRPISPPPKAKAVPGSKKIPAVKEKPEALNPRIVPKDPVGHAQRRSYLVLLHEGLKKLNEQALKSEDVEAKAVRLTDNETIRLALDLEEEIARGKTAVYSNVIKLRIVNYRKMKLEEWVKERRQVQAAEKKDGGSTGVVTGLAAEEEVAILKRFVARQEGLGRYGYVTSPPSDADIALAKEGQRAASNYEVCDRCSSRFQVFPDRRDDGALTTGGSCTYHWGKVVRPPRNRTDAFTGLREATYSCCSQGVGTSGCTKCATHVFKVSDPKRLAAILPYVRTPPNPDVKPDAAVCFDCEMGYTCYGLELIRLTATSWPDGKPLIDVLVRPQGAILDLNTRFSGVSSEQFLNAPPLEPDSPADGLDQLHVVDSPAAARSLLLTQISDSTPLLGHALENDLNAIRLVHPTIVDTVLLFPHPAGLPVRNSLRNLVKIKLNKDIQTAGAAGHSSLEDARAAGELARLKVMQEWRSLESKGWRAKDGEFYPPRTSGSAKDAHVPAELPPVGVRPGATASKKAPKRSRAQVDGADDA